MQNDSKLDSLKLEVTQYSQDTWERYPESFWNLIADTTIDASPIYCCSAKGFDYTLSFLYKTADMNSLACAWSNMMERNSRFTDGDGNLNKDGMALRTYIAARLKEQSDILKERRSIVLKEISKPGANITALAGECGRIDGQLQNVPESDFLEYLRKKIRKSANFLKK